MDWKTQRIIQLEKALEQAIIELREWNPDSETAEELAEIKDYRGKIL